MVVTLREIQIPLRSQLEMTKMKFTSVHLRISQTRTTVVSITKYNSVVVANLTCCGKTTLQITTFELDISWLVENCLSFLLSPSMLKLITRSTTKDFSSVCMCVIRNVMVTVLITKFNILDAHTHFLAYIYIFSHIARSISPIRFEKNQGTCLLNVF